MNKSRRAFRRMAAFAVLVLLVALFVAGVSKPVVHFDLFHQMALAREAVAAGSVPTLEPFAYTARVNPAISHEWGAGLIALNVLNQFGAGGVLAFHYALMALIGAGIFRLARRSGARAPLLWAALAATTYLITYSTLPIVAQAYSLLFVIALLICLDHDRRGQRLWIALWLPLFIVWTNVHGGVVVGIGIVAAHAVEQHLRRKPWAHLAALCAAMTALLAVNPYGLSLYTFLFHALTAERPIIGEWSPYWIWALDHYRGGIFLSLLAVFAYALWKRGWRGIPGAFVVILLGLASARAMKMLPFFALAWMAYVPAAFGRTPLGREIAAGILRNLRWYGLGSAAVAAMVVATIVAQRPLSLTVPNEPRPRTMNIAYPVGAVEYLKRHGFKGNMMTPYEQGAYVLWMLHPDVKVGMDSRYETAYDMAWIHRAHAAYFDQPPGAWRGVLDAYPTDAVLVKISHPLAERLAQDAAWRVAYRDAYWRVFVRTNAALPTADWSGKTLTGSLR